MARPDRAGRGRSRPRGDAKIQYLHAVRAQHQVPRFQIAMHDAVLMRMPETFADLQCNGDRLRFRKRTAAPQPRFESLSAHVLHHQVQAVAVRAEIVKRADSWVAQRRDGSSLLLEALPVPGVRRPALREHLQRHDSLQAFIAGAVHFAHAAGPNWPNHGESAINRIAGSQQPWPVHRVHRKWTGKRRAA